VFPVIALLRRKMPAPRAYGDVKGWKTQEKQGGTMQKPPSIFLPLRYTH